ncbi:MAG: hypothetical protein IPK18_01260 [Sphingobacteriales bacterium]|nr:MAG: hypothetical protein IPK18_01260 [Sphingobacteriales bacterium]
MVYVAIDTDSKDGKALLDYLAKLSIVEVYKEPNEVTKKAMQDVKKVTLKKWIMLPHGLIAWFSNV